MAVSSEFCVDSQSGVPFSLASVVARAADGICRESPGEQRRGLFDSRASATVPFLFFAAMQKHSPGFWDFFGPAVLALAPLLLFVIRNARAWRVALLVWFCSSLGIFFPSAPLLSVSDLI
jgi:hypothetical protein